MIKLLFPYTGMNNLPPTLIKQIPTGINIIVQQQTIPNIQNTNANGSLMNNQINAANSAPVILNPSHSINVNIARVIIV
jgi:hypothetical protein